MSSATRQTLPRLALGVAASCALACGGSETSEAKKTPAAADAPAAESTGGEASRAVDVSAELPRDQAVDVCVELHEAGARCAEAFLDTLLALRAKHNPGFAEMLSDPERARTIRAQGLEEVRRDGTGPLQPRLARCAEYVEHGPPTSRQDAAAMRACFAIEACNELMNCLEAPLEKRMAAGGYRPPEQPGGGR